MVTIIPNLEKRIGTELASALSFCSKDMVSHVESLINSGNKFRANLFYNASKCFGYDNEEDLLTISASLEILHRASLMHDDLVDKSLTRRGINTLHTCYGDIFAIYIPNLLRDHVEKMLIGYPIIQKDLMEVYNEICRGQLYEAQISRLNEITWEDYEKIVELKSAGLGRFVLETAYHLAYGRIDERAPKNIAKIGALLFQIVDDLEDLLDSSQSIPTDIQNGVKPAPWFFLPKEEQKREFFSTKDLQRALSQSKVLQKTYETAEKYFEELNTNFKKWLPDNEYRTRIITDINLRFKNRTRIYKEMVK